MANVTGHIFLSRGLSHVGGQEAEAEGITEVASYGWPEVRRLVGDGTIDDSETVAALMLAALELG